MKRIVEETLANGEKQFRVEKNPFFKNYSKKGLNRIYGKSSNEQ